MILTDTIIMQRLPELFSTFRSDDNVTYKDIMKQINPNSIDLTIGNKWLRPVEVDHPVYFGFQSEEDSIAYQKEC